MARDLVYEVVVEQERAKSALRDVQREFEQTDQSAKKLGGTIEKQAAQIDSKYARSFEKLEKEVAEAEKQIDKLGKTTETTGKKTESATKHTDGMSAAVKRYLTGAVVIGAIKATADWADRLEELSVQTGLSITALQKLDKAAKLNGSTAEQVAQSFSMLQERIGGNDKSVVRAFEKLGLSMEEFKRQTPEQQMLTLAKSVAGVTDENDRATIAQDLFGRAGRQLIPTLIEVAKNYDNISVAADDNVRAMGRISDWWQNIKGLAARLITETFGPFVAAIGGVADAFASLFSWAPSFKWSLLFPPSMVVDAWRDLKTAVTDAYQALTNTFPLPKVPDAPGIFTPPTPAGATPFDFDALMKVSAELDKQIVLRRNGEAATRDHNSTIREQRDIEKEITATVGQRITSLNTFFGIKQKNFEIEDFVPGLPAWMQGTGQSPNGMNLGGINWQNYMPSAPTGTGGNWWSNTGAGFNQMQSQWAQSAFSKENWASTFSGYGQAAIALSNGDTQVLRATNQRGRGKRAAAGALAGAQEGGQYGGPYGAAGGAIIGALIGAFRNPMFEDIANRTRANFGGAEITDDTAMVLEELAKGKFGNINGQKNNRQAAEIYGLRGILDENPLTDKNIDAMLARFRDAFSMKQQDIFSSDDLRDVLDQNFGVFADYFEKVGGLASKEFQEIITLQRSSGVESAAVAEYVAAQAERVVGGLAQFLDNTTIKSKESAVGIMGAAVLAFDELRKGPEGVKGAIEVMAPVIATIDKQIRDMGEGSLSDTNAAFNDMRSIMTSLADEEFAKAIEASDGLNEVLIGLHNSALLDQTTFSGLARSAADTFNNLVSQGKDGNHALRLMQPTLQTIWELQKNFGYQVDDSTQALLDQGLQAGLIGSKFQESGAQMVDIMGEVRDILGDIRDNLDGVGNDAARNARKAKDAFDFEIEIPVSYDIKNPPPLPDGYHAAMGGYVTNRGIQYLANGGVLYPKPFFMARGSDTVPAMLTPGEGVLSRRGMQALGKLNRGEIGGAGVTVQGGIHIHANSSEQGREAADAFMDELRKRGVRLKAA